MNSKKVNRGLILASAAVTGGITGCLYMWSIFKAPLMEANGWSSNEVTLAYSLFVLGVCVFGFFAGALQKRIKPSILVLVSGLLFSLGWFLTGTAKNIPQLYIYFGLIAGGSDGFIYNTAVSTATKWFPDKKGFANGVCIGCMGGATVIFAPLGNFFIENFGVSTSFKLVGAILAVCYLIFAWFIKAPDADWKPEGWTPSAVGSNASGKDVKTLAMLKHPMFWLMWVLFALAAASGMMMTGHASGIGQQLANLTAAQASLQVSILAAANFFGRLGFGSLSDKLGRYKTLYIVLVVTALDMLFGFKMVHGFVGFMIAICIIGACYGGVMTIMPTLCGDNFGSKNFGLNYACLYSGYTLASFVGPMLASNVLQKTGNYNQAFIIAGLMTLAGVVLVYAMSKYSKKQELNNKSE